MTMRMLKADNLEGNQEAQYLYSLPERPNCKICKRTKITRAPCRKRIGEAVLRAENSVIWSQQITRFSTKEVNLETITEMLSWCRIWPLLRVKTKTSQETERSLRKFLEPSEKPKFTYTETTLEFGKSCEDLSWNHCAPTPHRSETNGILERAVRRIKEGTSAVLLQSGLDEKWWAGSMECCCYLRNVQDFLVDCRTPYERRFGEPFIKGPVIPFGAMVDYHLVSAKDQSRLHPFGKTVLPDIFLGYALFPKEFGKEILWLQTLKSWKIWTRQ